MLSAVILFRIVAASQVLLTVAVIWRGRDIGHRWLILALLISICSYLMLPVWAASLPGSVLLPDLMASAIPGLLLLFAWYLFVDGRGGLPWLGWLLIAGYMLPIVPRHMLDLSAPLTGELSGGLHWWLYDGSQILKLGVALWALALAWQGREADLLHSRLRFRYYFCGGLGVAVVVVVMAELASGFRVPVQLELLGMAGICVACFALNVWLLQPASGLFFAPPPGEPASVSQPIVDKILHYIEGQRGYARHDLKIGDLADEIGIAEHVLRKTINGTLQQRNFNQFINHYRITEAAQRLLAEPDLPILTIALDVGFRSLSSFNSAFKQLHGVAPSQYRSQNTSADHS